MADDARDRFLGKAPKRGVGALKGYGQASFLSEAVSGFVGAPRRFSVMDPQAAEMQQARDRGEQASVASQLYGALTPFAAGATMAKAGQMGGISPLTVYHGSPHRFSKFDASKIGTGEGRQMYGYGLYFSEAPKVAKQYQESLSDFDMLIDGKPFNPDIPAHRAALEVKQRGGDAAIKDIVANYNRQIKDLKSRNVKWADELAKSKEEELPFIKSGKLPVYSEVSRGSFYTVDLPDEKIARMLDWDKPLSQQPHIPDIGGVATKWAARYAEENRPEKFNGANFLAHLRDELGGEAQAAEALRQAGIPGIKYLDQASRGAKQGTRNFVVFPGEEEALKILDVYAKGGAVRMQEGGLLSQFMGKTPKRGVSSLPGYGQGADEPAAQVALGARRNIGEFGRALVGAKPYDETNPTGTYRTVQALLNMPTPAAIIPEAGQAVGKAAGALSGLGALGAISPRVTKIVEPTIDIAEIIQSPIQQTVRTAPKNIAEMTAEMIEKGELNVREPSSLSGQIPSSSASNNIQPITTVQLPTGQFATTTGFSTVKPLRTGFDVAETPEQVAHLTAGLRKSPQEQVVAVVIDENNKPIQVIRHTIGLINSSSVEPFSLIGAIANTPNAKGFYISHNHPSGVSQLSSSDEKLADTLLNITKDTDIQMRGMLAIGKDKFAFYDPVNKASFQDKKIPPALRDKSIDMVERTLKKTQVLNKSPFSLPSDFATFADNFVGDQTGVVLLNNQNYPVGFMPIDATQFSNLRKSGTAINILRGLEKANANKAVLITKNNITPKEMENVEGFFNASSVRLLDALTGPHRKSEASAGRLGYNPSVSFQSAIPIGVGLGASESQEKEYKKGGAVKPRTSRLRVPISQDRDVMLLELVRAK